MQTAFTATIFLGAALLFLLQPLVARLLLPKLGGAPAVWTTCMLFFQLTLVLGYGYAHLITKLGSRSLRTGIHLALLLTSLLTLPLSLLEGITPPTAGSPVPWILGTLLLSVGPSFFLLSTSAPLLQRWYSQTSAAGAEDPYFLYAASNVGSLLALLAYPALIAPTLSLSAQSSLWSFGFGLFVVLTLLLCLHAFRDTEPGRTRPSENAPARPGRAQYGRWLLLAFVPSSLVLGVTQHLTTDVAAVPLLWVVPLALYLLTFVLAFSRRNLISLRLASVLMLLLIATSLLSMAIWWMVPVLLSLALHLLLLFFVAFVCHGRLAALRPAPDRLTGFYLTIAIGGALGGLFNAVLAPCLFDSILEYPLMALLAVLLRERPHVPLRERLRNHAAHRGSLALDGVVVASLLALPFGLPSADTAERTLLETRTFFGVHRIIVRSDPEAVKYTNGTTVHGSQLVRNRRLKTTYYHENTGLGRMFLTLKGESLLDRVGLIGLGVGTTAAWAAPGQEYTFFEIDPAVAEIANDPDRFTFLRDCMADKVKVVLGDGRLSLAKEPDRGFGLLVLDTFNSDAIPVHMLTMEALDLYFRKLEEDGLLAIHITNRYLDLRRLLFSMARAGGWFAVDWKADSAHEPDAALGQNRAEWVFLTAGLETKERLLSGTGFAPLTAAGAVRVWTDDYCNLFGLLTGHAGE